MLEINGWCDWNPVLCMAPLNFVNFINYNVMLKKIPIFIDVSVEVNNCQWILFFPNKICACGIEVSDL